MRSIPSRPNLIPNERPSRPMPTPINIFILPSQTKKLTKKPFNTIIHKQVSKNALKFSLSSNGGKPWRQFSKRSIAIFSLFKSQNSSIHPSQIPNSTTPFCQYCSSLKKAHQNPLEVKEHSPKVQKTHHNDAYVETPISLPLFKVKKLSENAVLPSRASTLSAGYDLSSATETKVPARGKALVPTDLSIAIPEGTYARVAPRSGLAWKHSIDVGAGVIDADCRGPLGVILFNHSDVDFEVKKGNRIAQLVIERIITPDVMEVEDLDSTVRGSGGFGSTGV